jgi:outer membrane lipoprotein-sorting protein
VVKPDLIRVTGPSRLSGDRGFEMASDGREFHLLIPEDGKKVFLAGPPDAALQSRDMRENVRPQPFFDALLWQEGSLLSGPVRLTAGEARQIRLELPPGRNGARSATIDFDVTNGVIRALSVFDSSGKMLFRAEYKRWEEIETLSRQPQRGCFPREIHLVRPGDDLFLDLRITQIDLNPEIPRSSFRMSTPKNIPVIYVDESGKTATRP